MLWFLQESIKLKTISRNAINLKDVERENKDGQFV